MTLAVTDMGITDPALTVPGISRRARIGRPPDTDPAVTRRRILDVARREFAHRGYAAATNRSIAAAAKLTTGAVYWEGASTLLEGGRPVGRGYLEMTGYVTPLKL